MKKTETPFNRVPTTTKTRDGVEYEYEASRDIHELKSQVDWMIENYDDVWVEVGETWDYCYFNLVGTVKSTNNQ